MIVFGDRTRTGISILTSAADLLSQVSMFKTVIVFRINIVIDYKIITPALL